MYKSNLCIRSPLLLNSCLGNLDLYYIYINLVLMDKYPPPNFNNDFANKVLDLYASFYSTCSTGCKLRLTREFLQLNWL